MQRDELQSYLEEYLDAKSFADYCPNGLQCAGSEEVRKIATGVTASAEMIRRAVEIGADTVLVHHGILWKGVVNTYTGGYRERVRLLIENNLNLFGFHLPLDAHPEVGNNVELARLLGLTDVEPFGEYNGKSIGMCGQTGGISLDELCERLRRGLDREPTVCPGGPNRIHSVGLITGGAQGELGQAIDRSLDAYITGECSEMNFHQAMEEGIHFIAAGHHATERGGPRALGLHLAQKFGLEVEFVDVPNPV
ncbi:MAG: dinuclear metal center YbgI/SA1388 family protein [Candidatus Paceibacteria bacterium]|jgi:dinuclear metal center YbgI/SA1388 family protein